jgi:hypothetical protein
MKKIILIIYCLSIINFTFSQNGNTDAEFIKIVKEYTLNEDGSMDFHYSKSLKLLSHFSFHRLYGETFVIYNTDYQKLNINSAYTIMADGKKIVTPKNAFNEVLPKFSNNAPAFNNIREMVITHTGLEVGTVINLDYTINSKAGYYPYLMGNEILSEASSVKELTIVVTIPDSKELNFSLLNIEGAPVKSLIKGTKVYTWTFNSIPANSKDYYQETDHKTEPRLMFSTNDMAYAYNQFVNHNAFNLVSNNSMDESVTEITNNESDQLKIALDLQKIVSNNLNNINIPLVYTGYECRTPVETWNSNQGTQLEKALLLITLLHKANIEAEPYIIIPNMYFDKKIGNIAAFNQAIVRVKLKKHGDIYLTPNHTNSQNQIFELGDRTAILLDKNVNKLKTVSNKPALSSITFMGQFDLQNTDLLLGNINLVFTNQANQYLKYYQDSSSIKSTLKGLSTKGIKSANLEKLSQGISKFEMIIEMDNPIKKYGNYMTFNLPYASNGVSSWHMTVLTTQRSVPLEIPETIHEKYEYAIVLPQESTLVSPPIFSIVSNDVGSVTIKFEQVENKVVIAREIKLNKKIISTTEYPEFKKLMDIWNNRNYQKVIFKK